MGSRRAQGSDGVDTGVLRRWRDGDAEWYVEQLSDAAIQTYTTESADTTPEDFRRALDTARKSTDQLAFAIVDPTSAELAGNVAASLRDGTAGIVYWLAPRARGRGLATRAVTQLLDVIRSQWPSADRAQLWVHADNAASARVAVSCGFVLDPTRDKWRDVKGETWPVRWYDRSLGGETDAAGFSARPRDRP